MHPRESLRLPMTWEYAGITCRLEPAGPVIAASCRLRQGHPWFGLPPGLCLVRSERIDAGESGITRCYRDGSIWVVEMMLQVAIQDAKFEVELLADAAAYCAQIASEGC
jgi:hypothetical protein